MTTNPESERRQGPRAGAGRLPLGRDKRHRCYRDHWSCSSLWPPSKAAIAHGQFVQGVPFPGDGEVTCDSEMRMYVLSDRATHLTLREDLELMILFEGDPMLRNQYSVITINPTKHHHTRSEEAAYFAAFLLSEQGQRLIGEFGVEQFGEQLFEPNPTR